MAVEAKEHRQPDELRINSVEDGEDDRIAVRYCPRERRCILGSQRSDRDRAIRERDGSGSSSSRVAEYAAHGAQHAQGFNARAAGSITVPPTTSGSCLVDGLKCRLSRKEQSDATTRGMRRRFHPSFGREVRRDGQVAYLIPTTIESGPTRCST